MQVQLVREIMKRRKEASPADQEAATFMDMEASVDQSFPQVASSTSPLSADPPPGPFSLAIAPSMTSLVRQLLLDTLSRCSDLEQLRIAFKLPSLKAASARLLVLLDLGLMQEARVLELHGIHSGDMFFHLFPPLGVKCLSQGFFSSLRSA